MPVFFESVKKEFFDVLESEKEVLPLYLAQLDLQKNAALLEVAGYLGVDAALMEMLIIVVQKQSQDNLADYQKKILAALPHDRQVAVVENRLKADNGRNLEFFLLKKMPIQEPNNRLYPIIEFNQKSVLAGINSAKKINRYTLLGGGRHLEHKNQINFQKIIDIETEEIKCRGKNLVHTPLGIVKIAKSNNHKGDFGIISCDSNIISKGAQLYASKGICESIGLSPEGPRLAVARSERGNVKFIDIKNLYTEEIVESSLPLLSHNDKIKSIFFSGDEGLGCLTQSGNVFIQDAEKKWRQVNPVGSSCELYDQDGNSVLISSGNTMVSLVDSLGNEIQKFDVEMPVRAAALGGAHNLVFTGDKDKILLWHTPTGRRLKEIACAGVLSLAYNRDGILTALGQGILNQWSLQTAQISHDLRNLSIEQVALLEKIAQNPKGNKALIKQCCADHEMPKELKNLLRPKSKLSKHIGATATKIAGIGKNFLQQLYKEQ